MSTAQVTISINQVKKKDNGKEKNTEIHCHLASAKLSILESRNE